MKTTAQRMLYAFAVFGLVLLWFGACKKEPNIALSPSAIAITKSTGQPGSQTGTVDTLPTPIPGTFINIPAIVYHNRSNITISGISTTSIRLMNCSNIKITNCKVGNTPGVGITISGCSNVSVSGTYLYNAASGVYAVDSQGINISGNFGLNMQGPFPRGQFVQFDNVTGAGNRVDSNRFQNILGQSDAEDAISIYKSSGTANDPIQVNENQIRGGGPSDSGSGIMIGDGGGQYVTANRNTLVDPGQCGMGIAGGSNMTLSGNNIYGKQQSFTNVGVYYWNQSRESSSAITISNNAINFTMHNGELNNVYLAHGGTVPTGWSTNYYDKSLGEVALPTTLVTIP
ncbi:MAG: right-handed parallel beta-helix repeat-containing protein [Mucilaginibacter sp.]